VTAIPPPDVTIQSMIDRAHEAKREPHRGHLGASVAGAECSRKVWLGFHWALAPAHHGRILRIFRRGREEEDNVCADLESIGVTVTRQQERVDFGSHVSGSIDGVAVGVLGAPKTEHLLEIKTHSLKSFAKLKDGVEKSHPMHWAQMQLYMLGLGLTRALYYAVCKNDDSIYTERVRAEPDKARAIVARAQSIAVSPEAPPRISEDPTWWICKLCDFHSLCHVTKKTDSVNCRTCAHSTARPDSTWFCERWADTIPEDAQRLGCPSHVVHPQLMDVPMESIGEPWHAAYGERINGGPELPGAVSSAEVLR